MAVTIDTTVGGASANSYVDRTFVDTHAEGTPWASDWAGLATDAAKDAILVRAARALDGMSFEGYPANDTQARQFPREDAYMPSGAAWVTTAIPAPVQEAQAHLAAWMSSKTGDPFAPSTDRNVKRTKLDDVNEKEYFGPNDPEGDGFLADVIAPMLRPWGLLGASGSVALVR